MNNLCNYRLLIVFLLFSLGLSAESTAAKQFAPPKTFSANPLNLQDTYSTSTEQVTTSPVSYRNSANRSSTPDNATPRRSPRLISTSMTGFGVPFKINDTDGRYIEVQLYVSKDRGRTWQFHDRKSPEATEFPFHSAGDGEYWFALKTLDRDRKLVPDGDAQPELKVIVDTRQPGLEFAAKTDLAGRVVCKWRAIDQNLDPNSLRISYQINGVPTGKWNPVEIRNVQPQTSPNILSDQLAWWPSVTAQEIVVRIQVSDRAGNEASELRSLLVPRVAMRTTQVATARPPVSPQCENGVCQLPSATGYPAQGWNGQNGPQGFGVPAGTQGTQNLAHLTPNISSQVGSAPEFVAPPAPVGTRAAARLPSKPAGWNGQKEGVPTHPQLAQTAPKSPDLNSIEWGSSETETKGLQHEAIGSTSRPGGNQFFHNRASGPISANQVVGSGASRPGFIQNDLDEQGANRQASNEGLAMPITPSRDRIKSGEAATNRLDPSRGVSTSGNRSTDDHSSKGSSASRQPEPLVHRVANPGVSPVAARPIPPRTSSRPDRKSIDYGVKAINSRRFLLNYNVDSVDPSGVGKVVLWVTRDGGQTWNSWATDNDNQSPFPVQVQENGTYGFRIVIHSNEGLSGRAPVRGDDADMKIRIDTEAPIARIVSVPYGTGHEAGRLVINWEASDEKLRLRPIKLAYSTSAQGPWTTIEEGLRNSGRYAWKVKRGVPDQLFLRMEVIDDAGNITVQQLTRPIDVSGLVPRGRVNGVQPVITQ